MLNYVHANMENIKPKKKILLKRAEIKIKVNKNNNHKQNAVR